MEKINEAATLIAKAIEDLKDLNSELLEDYRVCYKKLNDTIMTLQTTLEILL